MIGCATAADECDSCTGVGSEDECEDWVASLMKVKRVPSPLRARLRASRSDDEFEALLSLCD